MKQEAATTQAPGVKNKITIRFYTPDDFEGIISLFKENNMNVNYAPDDFGTNSLVAENKDKIVGFIWAICGNSPIIYIYDLVVAKKYHYKSSSKHPGIPLLSNFFGLLQKLGYTHYMADIQPEKRKLLKMAKQFGAKDHGKRILIGGEINDFVTKIQTI